VAFLDRRTERERAMLFARARVEAATFVPPEEEFGWLRMAEALVMVWWIRRASMLSKVSGCRFPTL
jgi:hypothetical protein